MSRLLNNDDNGSYLQCREAVNKLNEKKKLDKIFFFHADCNQWLKELILNCEEQMNNE